MHYNDYIFMKPTASGSFDIDKGNKTMHHVLHVSLINEGSNYFHAEILLLIVLANPDGEKQMFFFCFTFHMFTYLKIIFSILCIPFYA